MGEYKRESRKNEDLKRKKGAKDAPDSPGRFLAVCKVRSNECFFSGI